MRPLKPAMDELFQKIQAGLAEHGFEFKRKIKYFHKIIPGGCWSVGIGYIKHTEDFDVTMNVSGRIDTLQKLIHGNEDSDDCSFSFGAELGNISEGKQKRWTVTSQEDIDSVAVAMLEAFVQIGLPYLKRYSDMENALEAFSGDDRAAWLHSPVHGARAKRAIGLAFILNKRDLFVALAEQKTAFLKGRNDFDLQSFLDFKRKLEEQLSAKS